MHNNRPTHLDEALESLPQEIAPTRDLWPQIRTAIKTESASPVRTRFGMWTQLATAAALVAITATTTYMATRYALRHETQQTAKVGEHRMTTDIAFDGRALGEQYLRARADLDRLFAERVAELPPATRVKLESNLADLRRAADEIVATLAEHPSDPLLQELLISTRQRELQLLAEVSQLPVPNS